MNVQLYTGVTGWIKPNTERIVSKQLYASARRVQWKHTPQLELSLYIRVLFFFLMMKREYRRVSMRNPHEEHCTGGGSIVLIHTSATWNVTNANFPPNSFTESIISDGKDCSLWHYVDIDSLVTRSVSLSFLFRSDPPRRGKLNENKTRSKRRRRRKGIHVLYDTRKINSRIFYLLLLLMKYEKYYIIAKKTLFYFNQILNLGTIYHRYKRWNIKFL